MKLVNPLTKSEYYMYKVKAEDKIPADAENKKEDKKMGKKNIFGYVLALGAGAVAGGAAVVKILAKRNDDTSDPEDNSSEFEAEEEVEAGTEDIPTLDEEG